MATGLHIYVYIYIHMLYSPTHTHNPAIYLCSRVCSQTGLNIFETAAPAQYSHGQWFRVARFGSGASDGHWLILAVLLHDTPLKRAKKQVELSGLRNDAQSLLSGICCREFSTAFPREGVAAATMKCDEAGWVACRL